jgi:hypothetical protein
MEKEEQRSKARMDRRDRTFDIIIMLQDVCRVLGRV